MHRILSALFIAITVCALAVPSLASAQTEGFGVFDPIWPEEGPCNCPGSAPDWGCALDIVDRVIDVAIGLLVIWAVIWIAYAGFMLMTSSVQSNPGGIEQARTRLTNAVLGLAVVLSAWVLVDFVMKAVYNPDATFSGGNLGQWPEIWAGNEANFCIKPNYETGNIISGALRLVQVSTQNPGEYNASRRGANNLGTPGSVDGPNTCSWSRVKAAAVASGQQITDGQAKYLACIARPESSCGTRLRNYNWGRGSSAYGHFQVLLGDNAHCYNNQICAAAAGRRGTDLNCRPAFRNGNPVRGQEALVAACQRAAANLGCSIAAAQCVLRTQGPRAWSGNRDSKPQHRACEQYLR